jgi:hypothetical protein
VLAQGTPQDLVADAGAETLAEAFLTMTGDGASSGE